MLWNILFEPVLGFCCKQCKIRFEKRKLKKVWKILSFFESNIIKFWKKVWNQIFFKLKHAFRLKIELFDTNRNFWTKNQSFWTSELKILVKKTLFWSKIDDKFKFIDNFQTLLSFFLENSNCSTILRPKSNFFEQNSNWIKNQTQDQHSNLKKFKNWT